MEIKPGDIVSKLTKNDQKLLNDILGVEKRRLHIQEIKNNSKTEKEILTEITAIIDRACSDDN